MKCEVFVVKGNDYNDELVRPIENLTVVSKECKKVAEIYDQLDLFCTRVYMDKIYVVGD